jgi:hypothetical protein
MEQPQARLGLTGLAQRPAPLLRQLLKRERQPPIAFKDNHLRMLHE